MCLFAFFPGQVSNRFAGAVQFVRGHPFFRLISRGTLHHTPADRLRFLTFQADAANALEVPADASASAFSSSQGAAEAEGETSGSGGADVCSRYLSVSRVGIRRASRECIRAAPSPLRRRPLCHPSCGLSDNDRVPDESCPQQPAGTPSPLQSFRLSDVRCPRGDESCPLQPVLRDVSCPSRLIAGPFLPSSSDSGRLPGDESCPPPLACTREGVAQGGSSGAMPKARTLPSNTFGSLPQYAHGGPCGFLPEQPAASKSVRQVLAISDRLPDSSKVRSLSALLHAVTVWGGGLWSPFADLRVPQHIRRLLPPCSTVFCGCAPTALHVFTDGSADRFFAGWGAVLVAEYGGPEKRGIVAYAGCRVTDCPAPSSFSARTNNAAEAWAVLVAQLAALALPTCLPLTFWIDSRVTLDGATGQAAPASIQGDLALSNAVRASAQALQQRPAPTQWCWTPGHASVGCNELADYIAGRAAQGAIRSLISHTVHCLIRHPLFPWAWRLLGRHPALPPLEALTAGHYEPPDPLPAACVRAIVEDVQQPESCPAGAFPIRLLTANLCTGTGKTGPLQAQLEDARVHVAFFQETRAKFSSHCDGGWLRFCAAAERGRGGVATWISKAWKVGGCPIARHDCTVLLAKADLLIIRLLFDGCTLLLVNLHAPHSQHSPEDIEAWWEATASAVRSFLRDDCLIVGGDFNARVGTSSGCTGSHGPDFFDSAGTLASLFCTELGLCLANTYDAVMGDHKPETWRDRRLDYIAVPASCLGSCEIVDLEFDLLNPHEDHEALCLDFSVWGRLPATAQSARPRPTAQARAAAGRDPISALEALKGSALCSPSWETNIHTHADVLFHGAQASLDSARGRRAISRKPFTSPETMALIQARKDCDRVLRQLDEQARLTCLEGVFRAWRDGTGEVALSSVDKNTQARLARAACLQARSLWCRCVRRQLRLDKARYVEQLCLEFHQAALRKDSAALFAALRFFRPASKRVFKPFGPLEVLKGPDGAVAGSFKEQQMIRGRHFGAMEAAIEQTASAFAAMEVLPTPPASDRALSASAPPDLAGCRESGSQPS